ncbi:uncharacterized protein V6R79_005890 [Siganus canaliculatus]
MAAPGQIKSLLRHYLTELNEEMLREFQWCLGLDKRPIPWTLQDATREETVDTLVALYGEDDAAATTVDIFIDMRNHDLAVGLLKDQICNQPKPEVRKQSPVKPAQHSVAFASICSTGSAAACRNRKT